VAGDSGGYAVKLTAGDESATAPFAFDSSPKARICREIESIAESSAVGYDQMRDIGANLFLGLVKDEGDVAKLFSRVRAEAETEFDASPDSDAIVIRLEMPANLQHFPWEFLYDEQGLGFFATNPRYSFVRVATAITTRPNAPPAQTPLSMLAVIPEGSGLATASEIHGLKVAIDALGDAVQLELLRGAVTPAVLQKRLDERQWDIVHFIGHGDIANGIARVRLNSPDNSSEGLWLPGETFATFFARRAPRLLVLNSCLGGSQSPNRTLSGIPPFLIRQGVPAVIAMQFEIPDDVAVTFARSLYGELLGPRARGRIDNALAEARRAMFQNAGEIPHGFAMPVFYRAEGCGTLFAAAPCPVVENAPTVVISVSEVVELPEELLTAFRERRCIPVVSPEVLRIGASRGTNVPLGPRELALKLAHEANYPAMGDFDAADPHDNAALRLLESVCQHYSQSRERYRLLLAVQGAYEGARPPAGAEAIATWDVPGLICTYFDGLIEEAVGRRRKYRAIHNVSQRLAGTNPSDMLIVHLRGMLKRADSLVLTERDHEILLERMGKMASDITELTRRDVGRSILFIGIHPRDPLIRRLTVALRGAPEAQGNTTQGPLYFAFAGKTGVHDSYWGQYKVRWLPLKTDDVVGKLTAALGAPQR
jgi:hypothetical protein